MKIKKSLLISTFIMALILVVTIVSVSAAWFGDTLSVSNTIEVETSIPEGQIVIDTASAINNYEQDKLVPAIMNPSWMLTGSSSVNQSIDVLDSNLVGENKPLKSIAKSVDIFFPVYGIGGTTSSDGKIPVIVEITGAYIPRDSAITETSDSIDYIDDLIISMEVVINVEETETTDPETGATIKVTNYTPYTSPTVEELSLNDGKIYWGFSEEYNKIGLLIDQGPNCYIKLTVTFAKVDEELPPELMDTLIKLSVNVPQSPTRQQVFAITGYTP